MGEGVKMLLGMAGAPLLAILGFVGWQTPGYIPSNALARTAANARFSADARREMATALYRCRGRRDRFRPDDIGVRFDKIDSWRNDAGWLGRTSIRCADGQACTVTASALIAAPLKGAAGCRLGALLSPEAAAPRRS